jgi:UDP-N-acetylglucosamine diphosphorylase/glucosamine-1-phosphate N-acetyltransferase
VHRIGEHPVWAHPSALVEPGALLDTTAGPILLEAGAQVQAFTRLMGPAWIGEGSSVSTDKVATISIGPHCKVHGEMSHTILFGYANKGHDGFVGHSVLGRWVNLGAGTITSNLKNTYGSVSLWTPDGVRDSGQQFLGTLFGDHAKTGIGLRLTTGCVIGAGANCFDAMPPKVVAPFSWGSGAPYGDHALDKFLETAGRMMARRGQALDADGRAHWTRVHAARWRVDG